LKHGRFGGLRMNAVLNNGRFGMIVSSSLIPLSFHKATTRKKQNKSLYLEAFICRGNKFL
jgi:hypothetical protein